MSGNGEEKDGLLERRPFEICGVAGSGISMYMRTILKHEKASQVDVAIEEMSELTKAQIKV